MRVVGFLLLVLGVVLAHQVEPGVRVESVRLAEETPALRFSPTRPGPLRLALMAHGVTASKETLFCLGEALAQAGFTAYAVDLPGHGTSPGGFRPRLNGPTLVSVARALGPLEVYLGHSMGAYAGAEAGLTPRVFLALGALPDRKPVVLLAGRWEEACPVARLQASGNPLIVSPWSDHDLEPYDPVLIRAAVEATGEPFVPRSAWLWRMAGGLLALLGAFLQKPGPTRAAVVILAVILTAAPWLDASPNLARVPLQLALMGVAYLVIRGLGKLSVPRWTLPAAGASTVLLCAGLGYPFPALFAALFTLLLVLGALLRSDLAMAIFLGYAVGQWFPRVF